MKIMISEVFVKLIFFKKETLQVNRHFLLHFNVVLRFESIDEILKCDHSERESFEQYFPVVLFIMLYKVVLTFESVDEMCVTIHMKAIE